MFIRCQRINIDYVKTSPVYNIVTLFYRFRIGSHNIGRAVRQHKPPGMEDRIPQLGRPLQANTQEVARPTCRAKSSLFTAG